MQQNDLQRMISTSILKLQVRTPFFATLALFARVSKTETISTAATDGRDIFINEQFWQGMTPEERLGVFTHEVLHAALLHIPRREQRDPLLWNIAADIVVNGIILSQPGFKLPEGHIRDEKLEHLSVEEIYHLMLTNPDKYKYKLVLVDLIWSDKDGIGIGEFGKLGEYWRHAMQNAHTISRMLGKEQLPAGLERELPHMNQSQLDWRSYLWRFLVQTPTDFQDFDRRFIGRGLYLEGLVGESIHVYVAVDTSGSVGKAEISLFLGEVVGILNAYPHIVASLYYVDAKCYGPYQLTDQANIPPPVGGGGTDFRPFFKAVEDDPLRPYSCFCVYLTDGYGAFPKEAPPMPVLWVLSPGGLSIGNIPFGESVRLIPDAI